MNGGAAARGDPLRGGVGDSMDGLHDVPPFWRRVLAILWCSFLVAGAQAGLVFVVVDPATLHWFGADPVDWPVQAVYTVSFLLLWFTTSLACALCELLRSPHGP